MLRGVALLCVVQAACLLPLEHHAQGQQGTLANLQRISKARDGSVLLAFLLPRQGPTRLHRLRGGSDLEVAETKHECAAVNESRPTAPGDSAPDADTTAGKHNVSTKQGNSKSDQDEFHVLQEGAAKFQVARGKVFYNKAMVVNRDLSVLVLRYFVEARRLEIRQAADRKVERARGKLASLNVSATAAENASATAGLDPETAAEAQEEGGALRGHEVFAGDKEDETMTEQGEGEGGDEGARAPSDAPAGFEFRPFRVLDAMSASGLRALRYALEVPHVGHVVANDLDEAAAGAIRENMALNGLDAQRVAPTHGDAAAVLLRAGANGGAELFDVVDLDPFGSAGPLLSAALHGVASGGLLCVTCTDMRVLAGHQPDACFARYGATSVRAPEAVTGGGRFGKEVGLRILLHAIQAAASPLGKAVEAVLSVSVDFYVRVFVRVRSSRHAVQQACLRSALLYTCRSCNSFFFQPLAQHRKHTLQAAHGPPPGLSDGSCCGLGPFVLAGPLWTGPIADKQVTRGGQVRELLEEEARGGRMASAARLRPLLTLLSAELPAPLFMSHPAIVKVLKCSPPRLAGVRALLARAGYNVSLSHIDPQAIKTDAPLALVWDLYRVWMQTRGSGHASTPAGGQLAGMGMQQLNRTLLNGTDLYALRFDGPDPCQEAAAHGSAGAGSKRRRPQLYPRTEGYGPKRSVGFRGRQGGAGQRGRRGAGEESDEEVLPGGMGLPPEALAVPTWSQVGGETDKGEREEEQEGSRTVDWFRRQHDMARAPTHPSPPSPAGPRHEPAEAEADGADDTL